MKAHIYGSEGAPSLMLLPGLGVSYEMFLPLISLLEDKFHVVAMEVDGFILGEYTAFTSIDNQAEQAITFVKEHLGGRLDCAYGLSMGGKILSRILERDEIEISHAVSRRCRFHPWEFSMSCMSGFCKSECMGNADRGPSIEGRRVLRFARVSDIPAGFFVIRNDLPSHGDSFTSKSLYNRIQGLFDVS